MKIKAEDSVIVQTFLDKLLDCKGVFIETTTKSYPTAADLLYELNKK